MKAARAQVEALNYALENVPADRARLHLCWGNYEGPHHHDIDLREIIDIVFAAKPQAIQFEGANPRHQHEWRTWAEADIPDDKILIPGCLDTTTNFIEHPELVAERIERYCGNRWQGTRAGRYRLRALAPLPVSAPSTPISPTPKLRSLAEGARIASEKPLGLNLSA